VIVDEPLWINDVAMLADGGFVATHMMSRTLAATMLDRPAADGVKSGAVVTWQRGKGWKKIPGPEGALPNGVQASRDGRTIYVDLYLENAVAAFERDTGRLLWRAPVGGAPDNMSITPDGNLLVSTHPISLAQIRDGCLSKSLELCELPFIVYGVNATTGAVHQVHAGSGAPIGGVTVARSELDDKTVGQFTLARNKVAIDVGHQQGAVHNLQAQRIYKTARYQFRFAIGADAINLAIAI
jgi:sugar lactone lactonase YvrE